MKSNGWKFITQAKKSAWITFSSALHPQVMFNWKKKSTRTWKDLIILNTLLEKKSPPNHSSHKKLGECCEGPSLYEKHLGTSYIFTSNYEWRGTDTEAFCIRSIRFFSLYSWYFQHSWCDLWLFENGNMASAYGDNRGCSRNFANDNGKKRNR